MPGLGEVFHAVLYNECVRGESGVCRLVAGVRGSTQHLYHIAGELSGNDAVPRAGLRFIAGYPFRGGKARVAGGYVAAVSVSVIAVEPYHDTHPFLDPVQAY